MMTMEMKSHVRDGNNSRPRETRNSHIVARCQRRGKPASIPQLGSSTPREATARDSDVGNAHEKTRVSSTRG